ncbi:MAG: ATP-binding cassette domain-containing protein [Deltaproteobacteria bacterium]|nr:ATP-binding cassette domain-containing protein [Deltaproteobacteria bacterium]
MATNHILRIENLKKYFSLRSGLLSRLAGREGSYIRAVDNISFHVGRGEILGFVGESGCGKSTMSRTILKLVEPTGGKIYFDDTRVDALGKSSFKPYRRKMQMIFQDPFGSLNPRRTVSETLRQTIRIHSLANGKAAEDELITRTLAEVGLHPVDEYWDKYPALLSGGQLQRVSIGRVLILQPKLVIADESVSMLDVSVRIGILDLILKMRDKYGISFIYITHDLITARYVCDRIAIMYLGKILEVGPTETIINHPCHPYTRALISAVPVPDPTAKTRELPIRGYVPIMPEDTIGCCSFEPRCLERSKLCRTGQPKMVQVGDGHFASCSLIEGRDSGAWPAKR